MIVLLAAALLLPPVPAARIAARATGVSEPALVAIAWRESYGTRVDVHRGDARWSATVCRNAVRTGWLHDGADCTLPGWSTRGAFGLMAAYNLRWAWLDRWPALLDIPLVSAFAAARRFAALCPGDEWCG